MNALELYAAFCHAQSVSINAQITAGCKVIIIEERGQDLYLKALKFMAESIEAMKSDAD